MDNRLSSASARGLVDVEGAAAYLGISRAMLYKLLAPRGTIPVVKIGRSTRVAVKSLDAFIDAHLAAGEAGR